VNKTDFIIVCTSRERSKLTHFFPMSILNHSITPSDTVRNPAVTFDCDFNSRKHISLTCRGCFYHIRHLRRVRRFISLSIAKIIATTHYNSRLDYCKSLLYSIASKDILKFHCVQKFLHLLPVQSLIILKLCTIAYQIKLFLLENLLIYFP